MGLLDKLRGQGRKPEKTPLWMDAFREEWEQLDRVTSAAKGSDANRVCATIVPLLVDDVAVLKKNFTAFASGFIAIGLMPALGKRQALGVTWCEACQHPTMTIAEPSLIQKQDCSICKRLGEIHFLDYAPAVGKLVRDLFSKQAAYVDLISGAREFESSGKSDLALALYSEAQATARSAGIVRSEAGALSAMADLKFRLKEFDAALNLNHESQRLYEKAAYRLGFMYAMQMRGLIFWSQSEVGRARVLFERVEDMCRLQTNDPDYLLRLATVLGHKALIFLTRLSTLDQALAVAEEGRDTARALNRMVIAKGAKAVMTEDDTLDHVEKVLNTLGNASDLVREAREVLYGVRGSETARLETLLKLEGACRTIGDMLSLNRCLNARFELCHGSADNPELARLLELPRLCEEIESVTRKRGDDKALAAALHVRSQILTKLRDDGAAAKAREAQAALQAVDAVDRDVAVLERKELAANQAAGWPRLRELANQHVAVLRSHGRTGELTPVLSRLADAERGLGNLAAVCDAYEQIEAVGHDWGESQLVADAQTAQGEVLQETGDWDGALGRYERAALGRDEIVERGATPPEVLSDRRNDFLRVRQIGDLHSRKGDAKAAAYAFRTAVAIGERMLSHPPVDYELRFHHLSAIDELGITLLKGDRKQREEGLFLVRKALECLDQLDVEDPDHRAAREDVRREIRSHITG